MILTFFILASELNSCSDEWRSFLFSLRIFLTETYVVPFANWLESVKWRVSHSRIFLGAQRGVNSSVEQSTAAMNFLLSSELALKFTTFFGKYAFVVTSLWRYMKHVTSGWFNSTSPLVSMSPLYHDSTGWKPSGKFASFWFFFWNHSFLLKNEENFQAIIWLILIKIDYMVYPIYVFWSYG